MSASQFYMGLAIVILFIGCLFLTRKKFVFSKYCTMLLLFAIFLGPRMVEMPAYRNSILDIVVILLFIPVVYFIVRNRYTIANVDVEMMKNTIIAVLEREGVSYHVVNDHVISLDEMQKNISYYCSLNCAEINFKKVRDLPNFNLLKKEIFHSIKNTDTKVFPSTGILLLVMGLVVMFFSHEDDSKKC